MMKQQYEKDATIKSQQLSEKQKNLKRNFPNLNSKEIGILFNVLEGYHKLMRYSEKDSSAFFSSLGYRVYLSNDTHQEIIRRGKSKN